MKALKIGELHIPVPIIQGGMGIGISMSRLASAVANMGGIGVISTIGIGLTTNKIVTNFRKNNIEVLRSEIRKARAKTNGIIGVNIMTVINDFAEMVRTSIDEGIDIIFSGAGLPLNLPRYLTLESKTKLVPIISSGRAASILCDKWYQQYQYLPDAFVVEGPKAGGHLGFKRNTLTHKENRLENLVDDVLQVIREVEQKYKKVIPVIAAGGIFTGTDIYKILKRGASAVQLGSRFVATHECDAADAFKQAFINANKETIQIINSPVGMPGRGIINTFLDEAKEGIRRPEICRYNCIKSCDPKSTSYCIADALYQAYNGNLEDGFVFAGENARRINKITSVKQIFNELRKQYFKYQMKENENQ